MIIDRYIEAIENRTCVWNDDLERLQGSLFGYEDWQNDWWIEHKVRKSAWWHATSAASGTSG